MECHIDILVQHIDGGRSARSGSAKLAAASDVIEVQLSINIHPDAYLVMNGALGAWTFVNGPVAL